MMDETERVSLELSEIRVEVITQRAKLETGGYKTTRRAEACDNFKLVHMLVLT